MTLRLFFSIVVSLSFIQGFSQDTGDCNGAIPLCGGIYSEDEAPTGFGTILEQVGDCNTSGEVSSTWYTFTVGESGILNFSITPNNLDDDYDWGMFDITANGCEGINNFTSPLVQCNSWGTVIPPNGPTGISTSMGGTDTNNGPGDLLGPPFNADMNVTAGAVYALVVMNWSQTFNGYEIDFTASSAVLYDEIPPTILSIESDCANTTLVITFSENILVESVQIGDFQVSGPGGTYGVTDFETGNTGFENEFTITLDGQITESGIYTFTITNIDGQVEDICGNLGDADFEIELFAPLQFEYSTETACNGEGGSFEITSITGGGDPFEFAFEGTVQEELFVEDLESGIYSISISDVTDCTLNSEIEIPNNEIAVFAGLNDSISCVDPIADLAGAVVTPDQNVTYSWSTLDGNIVSGATSSGPAVNAEGTYTVSVTNTSTGCTASSSVDVFSSEEIVFDPSMLRFPNVVTPDNDMLNDTWLPFLQNEPDFDVTTIFQEYSLKVYNRWGGLEFESSESQKAWTAKDVDEGNYFFILTYLTECGTGASAEIEGFIEVLR